MRDLLRNSLLLTVGRLPGTVGIRLLTLLPMLIAAVVSFLTSYMQWAVAAMFLYYVLYGFALSRFVGASYTNAVFDKYINVKIEGAQINRGLYTEVPDDDDDAPKRPNVYLDLSTTYLSVPPNTLALGVRSFALPVGRFHPRAGKSPKDDLSTWTVTDDWPERVPVTSAEVDVFEAWFGDVFDELFGPCQ